MRLADLVQINAKVAGPAKISKVGAGYVHKQGTDYRCTDCTQFIPGQQRCFSHGPNDVIKANGYCIYWTYGTPVSGLVPKGSVSKKESGYGEASNGTKCSKCKYFDNGYCAVVDEKSSGDDPGAIDPNGCCGNQTPKSNGN